MARVTISFPDAWIRQLRNMARDKSALEHVDIGPADLVRQAVAEKYPSELAAAEHDQAEMAVMSERGEHSRAQSSGAVRWIVLAIP
jgi:hypothetical protein